MVPVHVKVDVPHQRKGKNVLPGRQAEQERSYIHEHLVCGVAPSSLVRILRGSCENVRPFIPCLTLFLKAAISSRALIQLFMPGSVRSKLRWLWLNVPWQVVRELISRQVPTQCLDSNIVGPLWLRWVKGKCTLRCHLPTALLAEWPGSFTCHRNIYLGWKW